MIVSHTGQLLTKARCWFYGRRHF